MDSNVDKDCNRKKKREAGKKEVIDRGSKSNGNGKEDGNGE